MARSGGGGEDALTACPLTQDGARGALDYAAGVATPDPPPEKERRRRLPVLNAPVPPVPPGPEAEEDDPSRPPWHWIGFGTVAIFAAWLPLTFVVTAALRTVMARFGVEGTEQEMAARVAAMPPDRLFQFRLAIALPHFVALGLSAFVGGLLVGRFGRDTTVREASLSGLSASLFAIVLAAASVGFSWASLVTAVVAVVFAAWGGRTGVAWRTRLAARA